MFRGYTIEEKEEISQRIAVRRKKGRERIRETEMDKSKEELRAIVIFGF